MAFSTKLTIKSIALTVQVTTAMIRTADGITHRRQLAPSRDIQVVGEIVDGVFIGRAPHGTDGDTLALISLGLREYGFVGAIVVPAAAPAAPPERDLRVHVSNPS